MSTKPFLLLLVGILALGGSIGGAFAAGLSLGKSQGEEAPVNAQPQSPTNQTQQLPGQFSQEQLDQFRQQFRGGDGDGLRGGQAPLAGTIESFDGTTLTINTPLGPLETTIGEDTTIQRMMEGSLADLEEGLQATVTGQRGDDGAVVATSILVTPEGIGGLFGGRQRRDSPLP